MPEATETTEKAEKTQPEVFSKDYVKELRHENAGYRLKASEADKKVQEAIESATKAKQEADASIAKAKQDSDARIVRAELKAAALKAGMVDLDGLKLADLSKVKLNDDGEVDGAEKLMEELKKAKPYLFQTGNTTSSTTQAPPKTEPKVKPATEMTAEEFKAARAKLIGK